MSPQFLSLRNNADLNPAAREIFPKIFRTTFDQSGFAILVLDPVTTSHELRSTMVRLKDALSSLYQAQYQDTLQYLSLGRFDQQTTTKLHLDGAPARSFLMLGYEATSVRSELLIADYSRCAHEMGLTPQSFLDQHNPMFGPGRELLAPCTTVISDWQEDHPRIVVINNSTEAVGAPRAMQGVLHGATILQPNPDAQRVINSTMLAPATLVVQDMSAQTHEFLTTSQISGPITHPS